MQKSVSFINLDPSDTLKAYASEKLDRFDKFLENSARANVVLTVEKFRHIAEISISADRFMINAHEETSDMYSAIDMALDKLISRSGRIRRNSRRVDQPPPGPKPFPMRRREVLHQEISARRQCPELRESRVSNTSPWMWMKRFCKCG